MLWKECEFEVKFLITLDADAIIHGDRARASRR